MTNILIKALSRVDPTEGFIQYVNTVKPYHSKILDVLVEYVYTDAVKATIREKWSWEMSFTRPKSEIVYSCGYGYRWDPTGADAPESMPTAKIISAVGQITDPQANSFLLEAPTQPNYQVVVIDRKSNRLAFTKSFTITNVNVAASTITVDGDVDSFGLFDTGTRAYIMNNTGTGVDGAYKILTHTYNGSLTTITFDQSLSLLTTVSGELHFVLPFASVPYWPSGTSVAFDSTLDLPEPLMSTTEYYFIPTADVGVFNLATSRYPQRWEEFIDVASLGTGVISVHRTEPFVPGEPVVVDRSWNAFNNGSYIITRLEKEGNNFRAYVAQRVRKSTPVGASYDGTMTLDVMTYNNPSFCALAAAPDLHIETFIHENLMFSFEIAVKDSVATQLVENDPTIQTGAVSDFSTVLPHGYDVGMFDLGGFDGFDV